MCLVIYPDNDDGHAFPDHHNGHRLDDDLFIGLPLLKAMAQAKLIVENASEDRIQ